MAWHQIKKGASFHQDWKTYITFLAFFLWNCKNVTERQRSWYSLVTYVEARKKTDVSGLFNLTVSYIEATFLSLIAELLSYKSQSWILSRLTQHNIQLWICVAFFLSCKIAIDILWSYIFVLWKTLLIQNTKGFSLISYSLSLYLRIIIHATE